MTIKEIQGRICSPTEAVRQIPKGKHIFISSGAAEPVALTRAMVEQADCFADNTVVHLLHLGEATYTQPEYARNFRHNAFFIGANVRQAVHEGRADYTPVFLHRIPALIRSGRMPVDVALITVTPPDKYGFVNLGVSVDIVLAAVQTADLVIAQINPQMPVVYGAGFLPAERIDLWVDGDMPIHEAPPQPLDEIALEIGRNVASLIEDGSTLQMGIGQIPDATLKALHGKRDLGVWTEMFSDGVLELIENGNITNVNKNVHQGKVTSSFTFGTRKLYDFLDHNPLFTFHPSDYVNDPMRIARQHKMTAINSALQVDLTGQVCADSMGTRFYSGIGGQVDFIRGASMCQGGKPILAIRSTAKKGSISRIVPVLDPGAGVVTSRGDVRYVVTEFGIADLQGKSVRERAMSLLSIAHPDFREELLSAAKDRHYVFLDQIPPRASYPREYEKPITTRKGRPMLLRPVRVTDEPKLSALFYSLSQSTIYKRYLRIIKSMPHKEMQYYTDVDYKANMALVAETVEAGGQEPEIVGVAQYFQDPATRFADVAFIISDDCQGEGLGTELFSHLRDLAARNGVTAFTADVMVTNSAMLHIFHKLAPVVQSSMQDGIYTLTMPITVAAHQFAPGLAPQSSRVSVSLPAQSSRVTPPGTER